MVRQVIGACAAKRLAVNWTHSQTSAAGQTRTTSLGRACPVSPGADMIRKPTVMSLLLRCCHRCQHLASGRLNADPVPGMANSTARYGLDDGPADLRARPRMVRGGHRGRLGAK